MSNGPTQPGSDTGRSMWDFAIVLSQRLGLPILILIGILYALYKFQDQAIELQKEHREATQTVQDQLNQAHRELREASTAIGEINNRMIANIKGGLDQLDELQTRLTGLKEQAEAEATRAARAATQRQEAEEARNRATDELKRVKEEHDRLQQRRVAKSGPFRDKVKELVSLLSHAPMNDPTVQNLAESIRQDYLVDPVELFNAIAADPNVRHLRELEQLEGFKYETFADILADNEAAFAVWMLEKDQNGQPEEVIGMVRASEREVTGYVSIAIAVGRVSSVLAATRFVWVLAPSVGDWDAMVLLGIWEDAETAAGYNLSDPVGFTMPSGGAIRFSDLTPRATGFTREILAGEDPNLRPISLDELQRRYPAAYSHAVTSYVGYELKLATAAMMIQRAEAFRADAVVDLILSGADVTVGDLRTVVVRALNAAVSRDVTERKELTMEGLHESVWGRLAAAALQPQFAVEGLAEPANEVTVQVDCSFQDPETGSILTARIHFARDEPAVASPWRMRNFSVMRPPSVKQFIPKAAR